MKQFAVQAVCKLLQESLDVAKVFPEDDNEITIVNELGTTVTTSVSKVLKALANNWENLHEAIYYMHEDNLHHGEFEMED